MMVKQKNDKSSYVIGVDEAGRGGLCGPVVAAATLFNCNVNFPGLTDSKKLSKRQRNDLFDHLCKQLPNWFIGIATPQEIDELNILKATMLAMERAITPLLAYDCQIFIDGNQAPDSMKKKVVKVIQGDHWIPAISAASVIAKVIRDRIMCQLDCLYPGYGLKIHKGYPTALHKKLLSELGPNEIYRYSFKPVYEINLLKSSIDN